jgi:hypothetical protein
MNPSPTAYHLGTLVTLLLRSQMHAYLIASKLFIDISQLVIETYPSSINCTLMLNKQKTTVEQNAEVT